MIGKSKLLKIGRAILGIATEIVMTILLMALALGISWLALIVLKGVK